MKETKDHQSPKCKHVGMWTLAGTSPFKDVMGNLIIPISIFCKGCGEPRIRITKVEVPQPEVKIPEPKELEDKVLKPTTVEEKPKETPKA